MKRNTSLAVIVLLLVVFPVLAQAPTGWKVRVDRSMQAWDPNFTSVVRLMATASGFDVITPQAAVFWSPANIATGNYSLKGTFTLIHSKGHAEYYGLVFGGNDLQGVEQSYLYFMVSEDGSWIVKYHKGTSTDTVLAKTYDSYVNQPDANGKCTNVLEIRVMANKIDFLINGMFIASAPKTGVATTTDGVYGFRSNHHLELHVDGLEVSR